MSNDRQIAIRGDAIASVVVSGNSNTIYIYYPRDAQTLVDQPPAVVDAATLIGTNPYRGLSAFQVEDADVYFGREVQVDRLWSRLKGLVEGAGQADAPPRLLPILGPSGSGKSSLARAGLLPELARRPLSAYRQPRVVVMTPGSTPLEALAVVLARIATGDVSPVEKAAEFERVLRRANDAGKQDGLKRIANALPSIEASPLVVLIDQFEEVYSLCESPQERANFIDGLIEAATAVKGRVVVIIILRSDFLGETQQHPMLNSLISQSGFLVPVMNEDELHLAISEPAKVKGKSIDNTTVQLLIEQTRGQEAALPLLQYALTEIWLGLEKEVEPATTLKQIGGVSGALARKAQEVYKGLDSSTQQPTIAERIFVRVARTEDNDTRITKRQVAIESLTAHTEKLEDVKKVINKFADPNVRLLVLSSNSEGKETVGVTHEAIFEKWDSLKKWISQNRDDTKFDEKLEAASQNWNQNKRAVGSLWQSPDLDLLKIYCNRANTTITQLQLSFFQASSEAEERQKEAEERQKLTLRRGVALLALLTIFSLWQAFSARISERNAISRELALRGDVILREFDASNSSVSTVGQLELLTKAVKVGQEYEKLLPKTLPLSQYPAASPIFALQQILYRTYEKNRFQHGDRVRSVSFSSSGDKILTGSSDGQAILWNRDGQKIREFPSSGAEVLSVALSPDEQYVLVGLTNGKALLWNQDGKELQQLTHGGEVRDVSFSPDGKNFLTASSDKKVVLWNREGEPIEIFRHDQPVNSAVFNFNGSKILTGSDDRAIVWAIDGTQTKVFQQDSLVNSVKFSPDGNEILVGLQNGTAGLWDMSGKPLHNFPHKDAIQSVDFSPDGNKILTASLDGKAILWNRSGKASQQFRNENSGELSYVYDAKFSPDGNEILTGFSNGIAVLWRINQNQSKLLNEGRSDSVLSLTFSPDGREVLAGLYSGKAILWTNDGNTVEFVHERAVHSVNFHPDGKEVLTASEDGTVILWTRQGEKIRFFGENEKFTHEPFYSAALSPDGNAIVASQRGIVYLWSIDGRLLKKFETKLPNQELNTSPIRSLSFSSDSKEILAAAEDGRIWIGTTDTSLIQLKRLDSSIHSVSFSPNNQEILTASEDSKARIFSRTGVLLHEFNHRASVNSAQFSSNGKLVLTGSSDGSATIWNRSGEKVQQFLHSEAVTSTALSPNEQFIITRSTDGMVRRWQVYKAQDLMNMSCNWLQNYFDLLSTEAGNIEALCRKFHNRS